MPDTGVTVTLDRTDAIVKQITALTKTAVMVGIQAANAGRREGPIGNAQLGYIAEHGSPAKNIPARPWLIPVVNRLKDQAVAMLKQAAEFDLGGEPAKAQNQLNALGLMAQSALKANITAGGDPAFAPNAPATIARKGSSRPLVDTAQLLNSITYVIRKRS